MLIILLPFLLLPLAAAFVLTDIILLFLMTGLVVLLASKNKPGPAAQPTGLQKNEENETIVGPIVAGVIVAIVIVLLLFLLASWDRTERKMRCK